MWPLLLSLAQANPGMQVTAGFDVTWNFRDERLPLSVALHADVIGYYARYGPAPLAGAYIRGQLGHRGYRFFSVGGKAGVTASTLGDGPGLADLGSLSVEAGPAFGAPPPTDGTLAGPGGGPAIYLGAAGRVIVLGNLRYGQIIDIGALPGTRYAVAGLGLSVPFLLPYSVGRPLRTAVGWLAPRIVAPSNGAASPSRARWAARAAEEASAVGAFLRLAAELRALRAPAVLVHRSLQAAGEELGRTGLAADWGGVDLGPIPLLPARGGTRLARLATLAVEGLVDGLVNEGDAASGSERASAAQGWEGEIEGVVAAEERGHAALGGDVLTWAVREGGVPVARAVRRAEARL